MKKAKKPMTLQELARMVAQGFAETATKADIRRLDQRINSLDGKLDAKTLIIDKRLGKIEQEMEDHGQKLAAIEMKLDRALYREVARLEDLIRQLARKAKVKLEY